MVKWFARGHSSCGKAGVWTQLSWLEIQDSAAVPRPGRGSGDASQSLLIALFYTCNIAISCVTCIKSEGFGGQEVPLKFLRIQPPFIVGEDPGWTSDLDWRQCFLEGGLIGFKSKSEFKNIPEAWAESVPNDNFKSYRCNFFFQNINYTAMKRRKVGCLLQFHQHFCVFEIFHNKMLTEKRKAA